MSLGNSPSNNEFTPEAPNPGSEQLGANLGNGRALDGAFDSSLTEWRSAMKAMNPDQNIQVAGILPSPYELYDRFHKWLYPPKTEAPKTEDPKIEAPQTDAPNAKTPVQAALTPLESFTTIDKKIPPKIDQLPVGGPHLEGRSKDVVTSWYTSQRTAMMEKFDPNSLTAAHRTLPFNTIVDLEFYNPKTGETKIVRGVRINNDGPHIKGNDDSSHVARKPRELDVSPRVARELGLRDQGVDVGVVKMTIRKWGDNRYPNGGVHPAGTDFRNKGRELEKYWGRSNFSIYK